MTAITYANRYRCDGCGTQADTGGVSMVAGSEPPPGWRQFVIGLPKTRHPYNTLHVCGNCLDVKADLLLTWLEDNLNAEV